MIIVYIPARDVDAYTAQGWQCVLMLGHHGARRGTMMKTFMAIYTESGSRA